MRCEGACPVSGCRWTSSPIFGAELHAPSLSEPSISIGVVIEVTSADLMTDLRLLPCAAASTLKVEETRTAPALLHERTDTFRILQLVGTRLRAPAAAGATPNRSAQGARAGTMVS